VLPQIGDVDRVGVRDVRFADFDDVFGLVTVFFDPFFAFTVVGKDEFAVFEVHKGDYFKVGHESEMKLFESEGKFNVVLFSCFIEHCTALLLSIGDVSDDVIGTYLLFGIALKWSEEGLLIDSES
jgi:hypothetical protein